MNPETTPIITFVGLSGTGKTTFLEQLIPLLKEQGLTLAVVKHDAHRFEMDRPGKDTYRFSAAGADVIAISSPEKFAMIQKPQSELSLEDVIRQLPPADLILVEGYKKNRYPKIEIHRAALNRPLLTPPGELLAVMTDEPLDTPARQLDLGDPAACADLILTYLRDFPE